MPKVEKGVDDCLVQAKDEEDLVPKLRIFFEAARQGNMKFSRKKLQLGSQVEFGGYLITKKGMVPLPKKVAAIINYPEPKDESEMKRFLGMCNQFSKFFPDLSHMGKPLRAILKKAVDYNFGPIEKQHFEEIKEAMAKQMNLVSYDPQKKTQVFHDACETGLAYMIMQKDESGKCWCNGGEKCFCLWKILWCHSRALKPSYKGLPPLYLEVIGHHFALTDGQF
jgi:hypothetical protein